MDKLFRAGKLWEAEEVESLVKAYNSGMDLKQMATQLGRSGSSIVAKLTQLNAIVSIGYNYYPISDTVWASWQEIKAVDKFMKT